MILCCGEALIDMLPRETTAGEPAFAPYPGGAVFNTAIALGRLGAPVGFFSGLSTDLFGQQLAEALTASKVENLAHRSARPTTLAFVTLTDGHAQYAFYDEGTAGRMLGPEHLPDVTPEAAFFGGISLVSEPCASAYEALMARLYGAGVPTMLDPNIRPSFITDEPAFRARITRMIAMADIVKCSDEDLLWLTGGTDPLALRGPKVVCLTEGAKGARAVTPAQTYSAPANSVEVVDTVGAGDTFNAGFLAGLHRAGALKSLSGPALESALALGISAAAVTVSRAGANPPWEHEL